MKSWFEVPTTCMTIFILFSNAGVLFEGASSLWVFWKLILLLQLETISKWMCSVYESSFVVPACTLTLGGIYPSYLKKLLE